MRFPALLLRSRWADFFCTKKPFALICYLLIFNQQIMTFLFDLFLSVELYQLQCFCVDHILDGILDTHTKRRTFWTIVQHPDL